MPVIRMVHVEIPGLKSQFGGVVLVDGDRYGRPGSTGKSAASCSHEW